MGLVEEHEGFAQMVGPFVASSLEREEAKAGRVRG
jgi:hypothetical protein